MSKQKDKKMAYTGKYVLGQTVEIRSSEELHALKEKGGFLPTIDASVHGKRGFITGASNTEKEVPGLYDYQVSGIEGTRFPLAVYEEEIKAVDEVPVPEIWELTLGEFIGGIEKAAGTSIHDPELLARKIWMNEAGIIIEGLEP